MSKVVNSRARDTAQNFWETLTDSQRDELYNEREFPEVAELSADLIADLEINGRLPAQREFDRALTQLVDRWGGE